MLAESALLVAALIALFIVVIVLRSDRIIRQGSVAVVERLGRYSSTKQPGLCILMPFTDRIRLRVDVRQQVVSFPPQPVITQDKDAPAWGEAPGPSRRGSRPTSPDTHRARSRGRSGG